MIAIKFDMSPAEDWLLKHHSLREIVCNVPFVNLFFFVCTRRKQNYKRDYQDSYMDCFHR